MRGHVELIAPKQFRFQEQATYQSTLESISNVAMAAEIDGRITSMPMQQGQQVQPGDLLFTLDQVQQRAQVDAAAAQARKTRVNANRYIFLNDQGAVSTKDRDYYVTQAIESADRLRADQATLDYKNVVAPIAGQVGSIQHKLGSSQGETIVNIVDNSKLGAFGRAIGAGLSPQTRHARRLEGARFAGWPKVRCPSSLPRWIAVARRCWSKPPSTIQTGSCAISSGWRPLLELFAVSPCWCGVAASRTDLCVYGGAGRQGAETIGA